MTALLVIYVAGVLAFALLARCAAREVPPPAPGWPLRALVIALWPLAFAAVVVLAIAWALGDEGPIDLEE